MSSSPKAKKIFFWILINLLILELVGALAMWILFDQTYFQKENSSIPNSFSEFEPTNTLHGSREIHPYFGFTLERNSDYMNNWGFQNDFDFPYKKSPEEFVVAEFGGSVAQNLFTNNEARDILRNGLMPIAKEMGYDTVVFVNLALASWRQPQQFFALIYSMPWWDCAITVDGFNEIASMETMVRSGWRVDDPDPMIWGGLVNAHDPNRLKQFGYLNVTMDRMKKRFKLFQTTPLKYSMFLNLLYRILYTADKNKLIQITAGIQEGGYNNDPPALSDTEVENQLKNYLENYRRYMITSMLIARSYGKTSFHFLQPNQYTSGAKPFTEEEKKYSITNEGLKTTVRKHYPKLEHIFKELKGQGFTAWSLTNVFSDVEETIYSEDNCCHPNELGNKLMAKRMVERIDSFYRSRSDTGVALIFPH